MGYTSFYALGGFTRATGFTILNTVERAVINPDGTLGPWLPVSSMTLPRYGLAAVHAGGYIYALGGQGGLLTVERAAVNPDGSLGTWQLENSMLSVPRYYFGAVQASGFIYAIGGPWTNSAERAAINPDGSLGPWQSVSTMIFSRGCLAVVAAGGVIYAIGGNTGSRNLSSIERAVINPDGTLGDWQIENSMTISRAFLSATASGGYIYAIGGSSSSVERAVINADGSLGAWQTVSSMTTFRESLASTQGAGLIYAIGGNAGSDIEFNSVEAAVVNQVTILSVAPSKVRLSSLPSSITLNGTNFLPTPSIEFFQATSGSPIIAASNVTFLSSTQLTATLPSGLENGLYTVRVTNPDGRAGSLADALRIDGTAPTALLPVVLGVSRYVSSVTITLALSASDEDDPASDLSMSFSNDNSTWSNWQSYMTSAVWTLISGDGLKTLYAKFKDLVGNVSDVVSTTVTLDTIAPTGTLNINGGAAFTTSTSATLSMTAADTTSGVGDMSFSTDGSNWTAWEAYATPKGWTLLSGDGNKTVYVRFRDNAHNVSSPLTSSITLDTTAPTGSILINGGSPYVNTANVTLTVSAVDAGSGVAQMCFSNDNANWSAWESYAASKPWTLPSGDGSKWVYVRFKDALGNSSGSFSATIALDTTAPTGTVVISGGAAYTGSTSATLTLSASDATSGVSQMSFSNDGSTWGSWQGYGTSASWSLSSGDGSKTVHARFKDGAGNISPTATGSIILDQTAPTGSFQINGGVLYALTLSVTLGSTATDGGSGVAQMSFSNDSKAWSVWETYSASKSWSLPSGDGAKTVYARYRDGVGNVSSVVSANITLDTQAPSAAVAALAAYQTSLAFTVNWSGADATSGVATYDVQHRIGAGGTWTDWQTITTATSKLYTGNEGLNYAFRARATDAAGNVSGYAAMDTQTTVDTVPPTAGSIVINGGALDSTSTSVVLTLAATDATSGVAQMSFSADNSTWDAWQAFSTIGSYTLVAGTGSRTIYARFRDAAGNISNTVSDSINLVSTVGTDYGITINQGDLFTNAVDVTLTIAAKAGTAQMQISNDGGFAGATWEPYASTKAWQITQYGNYVIPRVVYSRFRDVAASTSGTVSDDIILDVTPPTGSIAVAAASSAEAFAAQTIKLILSATDDVSGVGQMMISNSADFTGAQWEPFATSKVWQANGGQTVYARFRDNAKNVSATYSTKAPFILYFPIVHK